jgi:hypothetical protein
MHTIATHCSELQYLDLNGCHNLQAAAGGLKAVFEANRQLISLRFSLTFVDDSVLGEISSCCTQLRNLDLSCVTSITDAGVSKIAKGCGQLEVVLLPQCMNVSDVAVVDLAKCCAYLRVLNVRNCPLVTMAGMRVLAKKSRALRELTVSASLCDEVQQARLSGELIFCAGAGLRVVGEIIPLAGCVGRRRCS